MMMTRPWRTLRAAATQTIPRAAVEVLVPALPVAIYEKKARKLAREEQMGLERRFKNLLRVSGDGGKCSYKQSALGLLGKPTGLYDKPKEGKRKQASHFIADTIMSHGYAVLYFKKTRELPGNELK